jgi:hypothetical protein
MLRKTIYLTAGLLILALSIGAFKIYDILTTTSIELDDTRERIPILIEHLLRDDNDSGTKIYWTSEMEEMTRIGPPAVPSLIEAIETAAIRAASIEYPEGFQRSEKGIKWDTEILQIRCAMVLGRIGDSRALPVLEQLKGKYGPPLRHYIDAAIEGILIRLKYVHSGEEVSA